jgi:hypothetical protein
LRKSAVILFWLVENFYARDRMDLIPAIVTIRNVSAGNADATPNRGRGDLGREASTRGRRFANSRMIADRFNDQPALCVHYVCQIQD